MTRTKLRTTIAILAAAFALVAVVAPVASASLIPGTSLGDTLVAQTSTSTTGTVARPNDGRFSRSLEAKRKAFACGIQQLIFDQAIQEVKEWNDAYDHAQTTEEQNHALDERQSALETAQQATDQILANHC
jgi:hypothetical protein